MPIITVQRRMAEQGRIRLGHKVTGTNRQGKEYTRPDKLDRFRFTSASQKLIEQIAETYGGDARKWDNDGKGEWEVITDARSLPVIVVKGGFSQWHEHFTKAGLQHRCDGEKDPAGNYCDPEDPAHKAAIEKPTTRLSVMLSDIETVGVWRLETHGWRAAAELPSAAELAMYVGDLVPATLSLREDSKVLQTEKGPQTSRFVVPVLDLHVTKRRLVEIAGSKSGQPLQVEANEAKAIEAPKQDAAPDYLALAVAAGTVDGVRQAWKTAKFNGHLTPELDQELQALAAKFGPAAEPDADGVVDGEVVDDAQPAAATPAAEVDADAVWQQIVTEAGRQGMTLPQVTEDFSARMGGLIAADATGEELTFYLGQLRENAQVAS